jgi:GNAT superfamily N-acetyltransferase
MPENAHTLRPPRTPDEWEQYHQIRRTVLFEARGQCGYDANHPDERKPDNHPLLLFHGEAPVGVIRIDLQGTLAIFRRVAVRAAMQRNGHGTVLLALAEDFARSRGCTRALSNVDAGAVGFYERGGFVRSAASTGAAPTVVMEKSW